MYIKEAIFPPKKLIIVIFVANCFKKTEIMAELSGSNRLQSLDAFRGFTIAAMILVNNPGTWKDVYAPLRHAVWWGITPTDMIPASFLFIVGVAVAFAYTKRKKAGTPNRKIYSKIIIRSLKIFLVGMFLNLFSLIPELNFEMLRWTGTLHRIAFVFLCCGLLFLHTSWRMQVFIGTAILLLYYAVLVFIPTPGYGSVMLEPGINIAHWIDQRFLPGHMWQGNWDPEGFLPNISSVVSGITGMLAGAYLLTSASRERKVINLFLAGGIAIILGILWGWGSILGVSANLWSPAYVLISSGFAASALAGCIYVIDILGKNNNAATNFGIIYGMNAITVYVLADLLSPFFYGNKFWGMSLNSRFIYIMSDALFFTPKFASMCYAILYVFICFIPVYYLYRKKIFIKL